MKITASFDSPDSADFAAGALKRILSPLAQIGTKDKNEVRYPDNMNVFAAFNTSSPTPTFSAPIYDPAFYEHAGNSKNAHSNTECILEVTCRREEEHIANSIIINHGGRNISKLS